MLGPKEGDYAYPPLNLLSTRRVHDLMLGLRMTLGLDGALDSCDVFSGKTREGSIQTRAVGCHALSQPPACSASELRFLNDNLPVWTVNTGAFQAKRVEPQADCAAVRALFAEP
jgi:hypothetical protein